ncbi:MAG: dTDP-4-dehydrorhamnose 3,5-epimerase [Spirochaetaceae bacterium]|jgi:dTDP-4-dehydrorhamnose 3,5-epimerase|nr:dTDP-4-dehydrorhamnose 3,5-epimerase [Spirochaetaceae bacterium]
MPFLFNKCALEDGTIIKDLYEITPKVFLDKRGYFFESYNERDFFEAGIKTRFVQDNQSRSFKGVLRGLHFQKERPQAKLVRVIEGEVFDVAVDLRKDSPTLGKWRGVFLSAEKQNQFFIPEGFAHGFLVLSENAVFAYKCGDFYNAADESGVLWNDPSIGVEWPKLPGGYFLSEKDKLWPAASL